MAVALEMENLALRRFARGHGDVVTAQNDGQGEPARIAEVGEGVLEAADGHVGEFADDILDDAGALAIDFGVAHAEHIGRGLPAEQLRENEVDGAVDVADEGNAADDELRRAGRSREGQGGFFHEADRAVQHDIEDVAQRANDRVLNRGGGNGKGWGGWHSGFKHIGRWWRGLEPFRRGAGIGRVTASARVGDAAEEEAEAGLAMLDREEEGMVDADFDGLGDGRKRALGRWRFGGGDHG